MGAHPYSSLEDLPGYVPPRLSLFEIAGPFLGASLLVLATVWLLSGTVQPHSRRLSKADRLLMCWWAFTGVTHVLFQGFFLFTPDFFTRNNPNYFDELWKEYSKGDSRYVARDTATLTVEGIMVLLQGPGSLFAVYAIASRKSYSLVLQFAVSLGHLYGNTVYYTTAYLDGFNFSASQFYFWVYFIGANSSWFLIPLLIARRSWKKICVAIHQAEKVKTK
ncbi:probable 3-beta-hydroxysteroid-Delta(8),Delta(7)-isomerase [Lolium rigidum]|uniref:probable 3-beta-hydroxysteroid-Delta(8),Delta(7)-isomerase n=1 Tax=Lolium rigidum TaxID=89674 RepID=UPI001F5CEDB0|nr:probable 3-beta-hydroxysteroid-Delta(8),Delta(7)-isomerase [Lolium rigidum]